MQKPEPEVVHQQQKGQITGVTLLVVAGVIVWALTRRGEATAAPAPEAGPTGSGEIGNLSLDITNPIDKLPGDVTGIARVDFTYRGPAQELIVGWGIKPSGNIFGINYDNGDHLIASPRRAWGKTLVGAINVPASQEFKSYFADFTAQIQATFQVPDPTVTQFGRNGSSVGLNFGGADAWVWVASGALVDAEINPFDPNSEDIAVTAERNILKVISPGNVINILQRTGEIADALQVQFA